MFKVLIIEDDRDIAALHAHFIEKDTRFQVLGIAANLANARELLAITHVDLLVVDNYLPDGLGVEFLLELLSSPKKPQCILVTAANDVTTVQNALRYGALDYLVKPLDYSRLAESLDKYCLMQQTLTQGCKLAQGAVDTLFHNQRAQQKSTTTDAYTLKQIVDQFHHANVEMTVSSIAKSFGISKSTARRYLDKAVEDGELIAFLEHGKVGRPTRIYRRPHIETS
ncbi:response regulator [Vibrio hepatarius]|jgi:two-component system response regulator CitB|uniref:Transcriptional regulatory protein n=1 Tax=Vibrio hepatarius TaxID=171383 RepID=A0A0M0HYM0_9VIBR|nr:response regulator [Vibrio hepatarius]KOO07165.1 chemotaxis protein CheY [Vibrio hepatarius]NOI12481.1 response regulator [Vibrio hepatarius]